MLEKVNEISQVEAVLDEFEKQNADNADKDDVGCCRSFNEVRTSSITGRAETKVSWR